MDSGEMRIAAKFMAWGLIVGACFPAESASFGDSVEVVVKGPPRKSLKGEIVRENLKGLILQVDGTPVALRWTEVDSADGRPVPDYVDTLKKRLKDALCPDCKGGLVVVLCPECLGSGDLLRLTRPCDKCNKTGTNGVACKAKGCDNGRIPCPGKCLKATGARAFVWRTPEGRIHTRGFTLNHVGEVFEYKEVKPFAPAAGCPKCKGIGNGPCAECVKFAVYVEAEPRSLGKCKTCEASRPAGSLPCPSCLGLGGIPCDTCLGAKSVPDPGSATKCPYCKGGELRCVACSETGLIDPKVPLRAPSHADWAAWVGEMRKALAILGDQALSKPDRILFRNGRSMDGKILHKMPAGVVLAIPAEPNGDTKVLAVLDRQVFRQEPGKGSVAAPRETTPPPSTPATGEPKPGPTPDTVTLKDGTVLKGRILIKSDQQLLLETADGKRLRIETEKIEDIRTGSKAPK